MCFLAKNGCCISVTHPPSVVGAAVSPAAVSVCRNDSEEPSVSVPNLRPLVCGLTSAAAAREGGREEEETSLPVSLTGNGMEFFSSILYCLHCSVLLLLFLSGIFLFFYLAGYSNFSFASFQTSLCGTTTTRALVTHGNGT